MNAITKSQSANLIARATLHGGFTVDPVTLEHVSHTTGYMVSNLEGETIIESADHFRQVITEFQLLLVDYPEWYIGAWMDGLILKLDISEHIQGLGRAISTARNRKQDSIYSFKDSVSIGAAGHPI